jgi:hypothetical protein
MAALPASPVPTISPAEMQILISRSGLVLNPGQMADLVLAWRQVAGLIAALPQGRPLADDMAYSFRLPPTTAAPAKAPAKPRATPAEARSRNKPQGKPEGTPQSGKPKSRPTGKSTAARRRAPVGR